MGFLLNSFEKSIIFSSRLVPDRPGRSEIVALKFLLKINYYLVPARPGSARPGRNRGFSSIFFLLCAALVTVNVCEDMMERKSTRASTCDQVVLRSVARPNEQMRGHDGT